MYRILNAITLSLLIVGIWRHDWTVIVASIALLMMWWLIAEEVMEPTR